MYDSRKTVNPLPFKRILIGGRREFSPGITCQWRFFGDGRRVKKNPKKCVRIAMPKGCIPVVLLIKNGCLLMERGGSIRVARVWVCANNGRMFAYKRQGLFIGWAGAVYPCVMAKRVGP